MARQPAALAGGVVTPVTARRGLLARRRNPSKANLEKTDIASWAVRRQNVSRYSSGA